MSDSFFSRWSKRKREAKAEPPAPSPALAHEEEGSIVTPPPPAPLPDLESLGKESDYSAFLHAHVPPGLRQQALDKLWASNPGLMAPETMDLPMGDYTSPVTAEVVKTAWRLGKGVLDAAELAAEEEQKSDAEVKDSNC